MEEGSLKHGGLLGGDDGETFPLLCHEELISDNVSLDSQGRLQPRKTHDWRAPAIILGFECLESLAFSGIATNLVMYLSSVHHESNATIATSIAAWTGTCYFMPFLAAIIADSYWGYYRMIFSSSLMYLFGMVIITLSASLPSLKPPPCLETTCPSATETQKFIFYSGLYLVAFGSGGVKSSLLPLGANQFNENIPAERLKKESFFNWFYVCINFGILTSSTLIVWIQQNIDWGIGFGIATFFMALAVVSFLWGRSIYRQREPGGSPLKRILQVFVASLHKFKMRGPTGSSDLYEGQDCNLNVAGIQRLSHTDAFRFLDKAATLTDLDTKSHDSYNPWRLCTLTQVEEAKILLRLFPIWVTSIIYSVAYAQMGTTFIEQGKAMDTRFGPGHFSLPPASLFAFEVLSVMSWALLYDRIFVGLMRSYLDSDCGLIQLRRIGIGYFLMIIAMATAAIVEVKRLKGVDDGKPVSILWQLPQYFIMGASEVFSYIGLLEFFYDQGPATMRIISTCVYLLTISIGNYLSSLTVMLVAALTAGGDCPGWIPDDLDEGHLDYFLWSMAGLSCLNFVAYLGFASRYRLKKVIMECSSSD